ncbi:uncharacterized protein LOC118936281 isoform X3 [Oncorhynchus mykiss]|uniref:uncharacterized protein LOC118936281 isoform X3 n=1 Tax=Oncorhynchus mykiss TaxID=8022 RepID=UPI0018784EEB|nr:uncharacterized protein LOC118936281 isoform X3 [Oncorhynchus mykiss]
MAELEEAGLPQPMQENRDEEEPGNSMRTDGAEALQTHLAAEGFFWFLSAPLHQPRVLACEFSVDNCKGFLFLQAGHDIALPGLRTPAVTLLASLSFWLPFVTGVIVASPGDPHTLCMYCLVLSHAERAAEHSTGCLFCVVFSERLHLARLEAMREWVGQAWAQAPSGVVRQRAVSPSTGPSIPLGSVARATAGRAGTTLKGERMPWVRRLMASMATTAVPCWPVIGCSWGTKLALFTTVSGATRLTGHQKPPVWLHRPQRLERL